MMHKYIWKNKCKQIVHIWVLIFGFPHNDNSKLQNWMYNCSITSLMSRDKELSSWGPELLKHNWFSKLQIQIFFFPLVPHAYCSMALVQDPSAMLYNSFVQLLKINDIKLKMKGTWL